LLALQGRDAGPARPELDAARKLVRWARAVAEELAGRLLMAAQVALRLRRPARVLPPAKWASGSLPSASAAN
jgi:hypothetical protein